MFRGIRLLPDEPSIRWMGWRSITLTISSILTVVAITLPLVLGLNFGIDFRGGTLIEARTAEPADLSAMRSDLTALQIGDVSLQEFGAPTDVLIRIGQRADLGEDQKEVVAAVQEALGPGVEYRRIEFVGPTVGRELIEAGALAVTLALIGILAYVWFRFEWQYAVATVAALMHDVITTIGLFALTQMEFNLTTVAAIMTIAGYSVNDTVVVFDRVRENLRRYKSMSMIDLLNKTINETMSRTIMTSVTTMLAIMSLVVFGGEVIRGFALALAWGIVIGTYSTLFLAVPLVLALGLRQAGKDDETAAAEAAARP